MIGEPLILVVEDDPNHVLLIQAAFRAEGIRFPLRVVGDGQVAMDYLTGEPPWENRDRHPLPAAIVLDLGLPRVSGFELLEWLQDKPVLQDIPVLVFTSSANPEDAQRAFSLGARAYRQKPADFTILARAILELLEKWTGEKEKADGASG